MSTDEEESAFAGTAGLHALLENIQISLAEPAYSGYLDRRGVNFRNQPYSFNQIVDEIELDRELALKVYTSVDGEKFVLTPSR